MMECRALQCAVCRLCFFCVSPWLLQWLCTCVRVSFFFENIDVISDYLPLVCVGGVRVHLIICIAVFVSVSDHIWQSRLLLHTGRICVFFPRCLPVYARSGIVQ